MISPQFTELTKDLVRARQREAAARATAATALKAVKALRRELRETRNELRMFKTWRMSSKQRLAA